MVRGKIKWSHNAEKDRFDILEYWYKKNGNAKYSQKLDKDFRQIITLLKQNEKLGKKISGTNLRHLIKDDFIIYYEIQEEFIEILHLWDSRRNPDELKL